MSNKLSSKWWVEGMQVKSEAGPICLLSPIDYETLGPLIAAAPELLDVLERVMVCRIEASLELLHDMKSAVLKAKGL